MRARFAPGRVRGFSLIEVLVALIIIAVGMLGLAKLQALTYSSTGMSAMRSIAAIEASSLAASMHTNRAYWSAVPNAWTYSFVGSSAAATSSDASALTTSTTTCQSATCTPVLVAARDLANWRDAVIKALPGPTGTVSCASVAPNPVTCTVQLQWVEQTLASNDQSAGNTMTGSATLPYLLYVVP